MDRFIACKPLKLGHKTRIGVDICKVEGIFLRLSLFPIPLNEDALPHTPLYPGSVCIADKNGCIGARSRFNYDLVPALPSSFGFA